MSCKYCELKMRPIDEDTKVLKGESWKDKLGEGGYIGQSYDDNFRMIVDYDAGCASTSVDGIKYCPFCGAKLTMPKEPLIKDPKIRKAVRAWAETNSINKIIIFDYINDSPYVSAGEVKFAEFGGHFDIRFRTDEKFDTDKIYTITELCGEEE